MAPTSPQINYFFLNICFDCSKIVFKNILPSKFGMNFHLNCLRSSQTDCRRNSEINGIGSFLGNFLYSCRRNFQRNSFFKNFSRNASFGWNFRINCRRRYQRNFDGNYQINFQGKWRIFFSIPSSAIHLEISSKTPFVIYSSTPLEHFSGNVFLIYLKTFGGNCYFFKGMPWAISLEIS